MAAANLVEVAALVGDTTRAMMLNALMDGRALTSSELAHAARISRPTASGHLSKLVNARLLTVTTKRRYRYFRIASPSVARMLESIKAVAALELPPRHQPVSREDAAQRFARTCYDHLAGFVGVAIADALVKKRYLELSDEGAALTSAGVRFLARFGIDLGPLKGRRVFCRACLDWSERRYHVAGLVGAAICNRCIELGWFVRSDNSRALRITPSGRRGLEQTFQVILQ